MRHLYLILFLFLNPISCKCQEDHSFKSTVHNLNNELIASNQINKVLEKKYAKNELIKSKYLGDITDASGNVFFLVNTIHIVVNENKNRTNENFIMVYSDSEFKGHYYLSNTNQLPDKIENNVLLFSKACEDHVIELNFKNGIPYIINLNCNNNPDIYEFIRNDD